TWPRVDSPFGLTSSSRATFEPMRVLSRLFVALGMTAVVSSGTVCAAEDRSALWQIVSQCLDTTVTNYCQICRAPLEESSCAPSPPCQTTTAVWGRTHEYLAIRDLKACGCRAEFVHGLAIPLEPLTGLGNGPRPEGIWGFAWQTALRRIADPS